MQGPFQPHRPQPPPGLPLACVSCGIWEHGCRSPFMRGAGAAPADLMVVTDSPSYGEDLFGQPMAGPVGDYLRRRLQANGIDPARAFFTQAIRCKVPYGAKPTSAQLNHCRFWLEREYEQVRPKLVLALGEQAVKSAFGVGSMREARSGIHRFGTTLGVGSFNPAGGFGDQALAFQFEKDLKQVVRGLRGDLVRPQHTTYREVRDLASLRECLRALHGKVQAADLETSPMYPWLGPDPQILCFQFSAEPGTAWVIPWAHPERRPPVADQAEMWRLLVAHFEDPANRFVWQNGPFDCAWLWWFGIRIGRIWGDTYIGHFLLDDTAASHSLASQVWEYTDMGDYWREMDAWVGAQEDSDKVRIRARIKELQAEFEAGEIDDEEAAEEIEELREQLDMGFTFDRIPWPLLGTYSGCDADATIRIWIRQEEELRTDSLLELMQDIYAPAIRDFSEMQARGVKYDLSLAGQMDVTLNRLERETLAKVRSLRKVQEYEAHLRGHNEGVLKRRKSGEKGLKLRKKDADGYHFNPASPAQLADFFYSFLGLDVPRVFTKGGAAESTGIDALEKLEKHTAAASPIIRLRKILKYRGTYVKPYVPPVDRPNGRPKWVGLDGMVHPQYLLTGTRTGRISCRNPNLLNIPRSGDAVAEELGLTPVKALWVSEFEDGWIGESDFRQAEIRVAAVFSRDPALLALFEVEGDIYVQLGAKVWSLAPEILSGCGTCMCAKVPGTKTCPRCSGPYGQLRQKAKRLVLARQYGARAQMLAYLADVSEDEAMEFDRGYRQAFPGVVAWMDEQARVLAETGCVRTLTNQRRWLLSAYGRYHQQNDPIVARAIRQGGNAPIQGTAAHICMTALKEIRKIFWTHRLRTRIICHVYDSLEFSIPNQELPLVARIVPKVMESLTWPWLTVPMLVDFKVGRNWAEVRDVAEVKEAAWYAN